jgi:selenocysteine-specific elongation factor
VDFEAQTGGGLVIIGTAGHIDHGKSALVTALTGRAVDRLSEERRRGITIELNFAPLEFEGLPPAGFIDVPGHEDFVRTMVAGATGIDLVLLVVDLSEGARPQTEEHLVIVEQLRIRAGIPVFTKFDLVDPDWAELVVADLAPRFQRSPVAFGPPAVVSAITGRGIPELRERLRAAIAAEAKRASADLFRLPVDRAFSVAGVGTVITGTAWSGSVRVGDSVRLLPRDLVARVRSVESYGHERTATAPGTRTALGLVGVERGLVDRGDVAVDVGQPWIPSMALDVEIELADMAPATLAPRTRVRLHLGTSEILARVSPRAPAGSNRRLLARLVTERPVVARGGDRFVIRSYSPAATLGGGWVLDPVPERRAPWPVDLASPDPAHRVQALVARRRRGLDVAQLPLVLGESPAAAARIAATAGLVAVGGRWVPPERVSSASDLVLDAIKRHHRAEPAAAGMSRETLRHSLGRDAEALVDAALERLERQRKVGVKDGLVHVAGFKPLIEGGEAAVDRLIELVDRAGFEPPDTAELARELGVPTVAGLVKLAVDRGAIAPVERDRYFSRAALARFVAALEAVGATAEITPARVREAINTSRKFLIPLLEWADRQGVTRRAGDVRLLVRNGSGGAS